MVNPPRARKGYSCAPRRAKCPIPLISWSGSRYVEAIGTDFDVAIWLVAEVKF
jgi:hypothetical protein